MTLQKSPNEIALLESKGRVYDLLATIERCNMAVQQENQRMQKIMLEIEKEQSVPEPSVPPPSEN